MLNGRVYGSRNNKKNTGNINPFANVRDEDPEFVEWGYGGMGSVKNSSASHGSSIAWNKVQSGGTALGHDPDDDDGSGAAWIRKRKEERARKAREEKEKAEAAAAAAAAVPSADTDTVSPPASSPSPATATPSSDASSSVPLSSAPSVSSPTSDSTPGSNATPSTEASPPANESPPSPREEQHHVLTISAPLKHTHHRSASAQGSALNLHTTPGAKDTAVTTPPATIGNVQDSERGAEIKGEDEINSPSGSASSESASSSSDSDESGEDEDDVEDDDDDDEEQLESARRTAISAGLEKISRHKDP
jgi:hypothetical protein